MSQREVDQRAAGILLLIGAAGLVLTALLIGLASLVGSDTLGMVACGVGFFSGIFAFVAVTAAPV